jgi:5-methylcytosine-specific restriction endonuclease McrA
MVTSPTDRECSNVASRRKPRTLEQVIRVRINSANYRADKLGLDGRLIYAGFNLVPETCKFCGRKLGVSNLSIDHIIPLSKGGQNVWSNIAWICQRDNRFKGNFSDAEYSEFLALLAANGWTERFFKHYRPRGYRGN